MTRIAILPMLCLSLAIALPAGATGITYDCDTAANHFSELVLPAGAGPFEVSGNVRLNALAASTDYVPLTRVEIAAATAPGQSPSAFAGFTLSALPANAAKTPSGQPAIQMLGYTANGRKDELLPLSMMTKPGTLQPFRLRYDGKTVVVTLGNERTSLPLTTSDPVVRIVCSTGEFLFTDLTVTAAR